MQPTGKGGGGGGGSDRGRGGRDGAGGGGHGAHDFSTHTAAQRMSVLARQVLEHIHISPSLVAAVAARYPPPSTSVHGVPAGRAEGGADDTVTLEKDSMERTPAEVQEIVVGFQRLASAVGDGAHERHVLGLKEVVAAHMIEGWVVRCFGAKNAAQVLLDTARLLEAHSV